MEALNFEGLDSLGLVTARKLCFHRVDFERAVALCNRVSRWHLIGVGGGPLLPRLSALDVPGGGGSIRIDGHVDGLSVLAQDWLPIPVQQLLH